MKLSDELKQWGYHSSLSEEGKKQHLEMVDKATKLEAENKTLWDVLRLNNLDDIAAMRLSALTKDE